MKLAMKAYAVTLVLLMLAFSVTAQTKPRSDKDPRNVAPTFGTGGAVGGPTGLFTVYDGQTLRKGEWTISLALSNYDRDPGNADFTDVPASFQIGLTNRIELFFNTNTYRGLKINAPGQISGTYLPNAQGYLLPAIVLSPNGPGTNPTAGQAVFRPSGMPFAAFPFTGANAGRYGAATQFPIFGFAGGTTVTLGPPVAGSLNAAMFPGVGSVFGGILPGVVLSTTTVGTGGLASQRPVSFTTAPSYLPDAPFASRSWATSSFDSFDIGTKIRFNSPNSHTGFGVVAYYTWYPDQADNAAGFNQLQRGAGPGAGGGDLGGSFFVDSRLRSWVNLSANIGYKFTTEPKGNFGGTNFVLLDRPNEFTWAIGADFPVNRHFQPILEFRQLRYVGGQTPNAFQNNPTDGLAGIRIFPSENWGFSFGYRMMFNQQDADSFDDTSSTSSFTIPCAVPQNPAGCQVVSGTTTTSGVPLGFRTSTDPHGYYAQVFFGHRHARSTEILNKPADVTAVALGANTITIGCRPGFRSRSGACTDNRSVTVSATAVDPENDPLTYNYTVSGGRVVGTGSNVTWDLSGANPGTYTITTAVDDGCGVCGKTNTQTITVAECADCVQICECPTLSVSGPGVVNPGSSMTFTANMSGSASVTYNWTVTAGTISSGQGSSSITVDTTGLAPNSNVTATVNIGGLDSSCNCTTSASETGSIAEIKVTQVDEFGKLSNDDLKARLDGFFNQLGATPNAQGYIINYGTPAEIKARRAAIMKAATFLKKDMGRVTFVDGPDNGTGINTKLFIVPAGATPPTP
jgi:hypothetical protein